MEGFCVSLSLDAGALFALVSGYLCLISRRPTMFDTGWLELAKIGLGASHLNTHVLGLKQGLFQGLL